MSKITCEICGTAYPDTATHCPTCGTENPQSADFMEGLEELLAPAPAREYSATKGGRFSKNNVDKRIRESGATPQRQPKRKKKNSKKTERALIIAIVLQLVAIVVVMGYIYFRYFAPADKAPEKDPVSTTTQAPVDTSTQAQTQAPTQTTAAREIPCTGLELSEDSITLKDVGSGWLLNAVPTPADTTDTVTFASADETIATVNQEGRVIAVAAGQTLISVTCGDQTVTCTVICDIAPPETTEATEPTETTQATEAIEFEFNTKYGNEVTLSAAGEVWFSYDGEIPLTELSFRVGKTYVATVNDKGRVTAVGPGTTTLYVEYKGQEYTCLIRCSF